MASSPQSSRPSKFAGVLEYFDKYDYPLTREEQIYWWSPQIAKVASFESKNNYFFLPGRAKTVATRVEREKISIKKWKIANEVGEKLKRFSFIEGVFVTGSLAMNNAKEDDDIDLMIIAKSDTLWITRFLVNIYLRSIRRYPNQLQVANVICINLWLDENNLKITPQNLYTAHEIMQAKVLWDRNNSQQQFLGANSWVKEYLPNAYKYLTLDPSPKHRRGKLRERYFLVVINFAFYILQYVYMKPKMTTERVGLGFAFFHPQKPK